MAEDLKKQEDEQLQNEQLNEVSGGKSRIFRNPGDMK